ncbi:MAG TPA: WXG100 family type VII secretion target [Nocardioides sp.]|nr:WXG100 family type VII secretion target [Nocardioides sp.]
MGTLTADHEAFRATVTGLRAVAARLEEDRDRASRAVDTVLDTWTGTVATAYAAGWDEWCSGAARVLDGLTTMTELLRAADADLTTTDVLAGQGLGRLTARLA